MRSRTACGGMLLVALLGGCVEEVDSSLRREETSPAGRETAEGESVPAPAPTEIAVTLRDCQVVLARSEASAGTIAFAIYNAGAADREIVVRGAAGEWPSGPVPAGATALMTVVLPAGGYELGCAPGATGPPDPAASQATLTLH